MHVEITLEDRTVALDLDYDPNFQADVNTRFMLEQRTACEPEVAHLMFRVLQEGDVAVDGGANIGFFSLLMAKLVGETGRVLAFEPGENNLVKLRGNIALNKLGNVEVVEAALWHHKNLTLDFYLCQDSGENSVARSDFALSKTSVAAVQLSDYMRERPRRIKLIKLDVEGSEQHALEGAYMHLGMQVPYIVCELNTPALKQCGHTQQSLRKLMLNFGYDMFVLHPDGKLPALVPTGSTVEAVAANTNVLFSTAKSVAQVWPVVHV